MGRRVRLGVGAGATCLVLAACAGPVTEPGARPSFFVESPQITSAARAAHGDAAEQAYEELSAFVADDTLVPELIDPSGEVTAPELTDSVVERFTTVSATEWGNTVTAALAGDETAQEDVKVLLPYDLQLPEGFTIAEDDPVTSQVITGAVVDLLPEPADAATTSAGGADAGASTGDAAAGTAASSPRRLLVEFEHDVIIRLEGRAGSADLDLQRTLSFEAVPGPGTTGAAASWLIENYEGEISVRSRGGELPLVDEDLATTAPPPTG